MCEEVEDQENISTAELLQHIFNQVYRPQSQHPAVTNTLLSRFKRPTKDTWAYQDILAGNSSDKETVDPHKPSNFLYKQTLEKDWSSSEGAATPSTIDLNVLPTTVDHSNPILTHDQL